MKQIVLLIVLSIRSLAYCCTGCVGLDDLTFRKVITKFKTALVKFDEAFPFGDTHEAFALLASEINNGTSNDILIATVAIKDYGLFENKQLGEKYGLFSRKDSPVIKLFIDGDLENPIHFDIGHAEKVTLNRLYSFLKANSKELIEAPGCDKLLDELSHSFVENPKKRKEILTEVEAIISKIENEEKKRLLKTYSFLMKGVIEKGEGFVKMQRERMAKLITDKLSEKKIEELNKKLNIIASFRFKLRQPEQEL